MFKRVWNAAVALNTVFQAIFTLLCNVGLGLVASWAAVKYLSAPSWIYVPLVTFGVISGLVSLVKFTIGAMRSLEAIEKDQKSNTDDAPAAKNGADKSPDK